MGKGRIRRWQDSIPSASDASRKHLGRFAIDAVAVTIGVWSAALLRYDMDFERVHHLEMLASLPGVLAIQYLAGRRTGIYCGGWVFGSFEEVAALAKTIFITISIVTVGDVLSGFVLANGRVMPLSSSLGSGIFVLANAAGIRYAWRLVADRRRRPQGEGRSRVIVFGAGGGGQQAIRAMLGDANSPHIPVAVLDDDPSRSQLSIMGIRVAGTRDDLAAVADRVGADMVLVAVPSADGSVLREIADLVVPLGLKLRVLPSVGELLGAEINLGDIRTPTEADLLGRHQVETNVAEISQYLTGKVVVVTGAGGSIGSELCRQIANFEPAELIMVDRDESALHGVQLSLEGRALLDSPNLLLLDIRDRARVKRLFMERRPDVVFHAAALKHLPLLQAHPVEALKTNVWGTSSVLDAAMASGVTTFVNISTDKAANPISVLGYSKRIAEGLTADAATSCGQRYLSVRFGNVLGSRGSVLTTFRAQIAAGGPLTVTHPDATRFFMTIEEAVQLVIQAGALGDPGEALVLDMGDPVRIAEVARRLAGLAAVPVPIEFTGLRPGEKLHEDLFGDFEDARTPRHELIDAVAVPCVMPERVRHLDPDVPGEQVVAVLRGIVDEMAAVQAAEESEDIAVSA